MQLNRFRLIRELIKGSLSSGALDQYFIAGRDFMRISQFIDR